LELNFNNFIIKINELTKSSHFECRASTTGLKLQTFNSDSYRAIVKYLKENEVPHQSFPNKEDNPYEVVIKNLHSSTDISFIKSELSALGFQARNINNVRHRQSKLPFPIFFIDFFSDPESYRPISLLPTLGKIFEKILLKRLTAIAIKQIALADFQFGLRANQLVRVVDYIASTLETKKYCSGLFLVVPQAFDTVWHDGLLFKLKNIFPAPYYFLLKSYLSDRSFRVKINTTISSLQTISAGVPQGNDIAPFTL